MFTSGLNYVAISRAQSILEIILQVPLKYDDFCSHSTVTDRIKEVYTELAKKFPQVISEDQIKKERKKL